MIISMVSCYFGNWVIAVIPVEIDKKSDALGGTWRIFYVADILITLCSKVLALANRLNKRNKRQRIGKSQKNLVAVAFSYANFNRMERNCAPKEILVFRVLPTY